MEEYSLDRHLKSYCDAHEEYQNLYATWSLNRKSCSEMLKTVLLRYPHYSLHDASHAEAILSKIEMLLGSRVSQLSPYGHMAGASRRLRTRPWHGGAVARFTKRLV